MCHSRGSVYSLDSGFIIYICHVGQVSTGRAWHSALLHYQALLNPATDTCTHVGSKPFLLHAVQLFRGKKRKFVQTSKHMSTIELRKRLIDKIQKTDNESLLEEAYRLLELETENIDVYKLTDDQRKAVNEGKQQIKDGKFLTDEQANKEIDGWLSK